jgi:hypothetical protein
MPYHRVRVLPQQKSTRLDLDRNKPINRSIDPTAFKYTRKFAESIKMPLLLPTDGGDDDGSSSSSPPSPASCVLTAADLAPLLEAALRQERAVREQRRWQQQQQQQEGPRSSAAAAAATAASPAQAHQGPQPFAELWSELMGRRCPALLARSLALAQHGTLKDIVLQQPQSISRQSSSFLYVMQHEYAVLAPPNSTTNAPAFIASDEATTCHLLALREPATGVVGLAHLDSGEAVGDLAAMERRVWEEVARQQPEGATGGTGPRALDVYIVGGYDTTGGGGGGDAQEAHTHSGGELLTARILTHFAAASDSDVEYRLHVALVAGSNTTTLPHPSGLDPGIPAPRCRSLGFCLRTGQPFVGEIPLEVKGPLRALRALRLWGWGARNMVELQQQRRRAGEGGEIEVEIDEIEIVVAPFRYEGGPQAAALLSIQDDAELVRFTSTSPAVEAPTFAQDMRETLQLLCTTRPEDFFGPLASAPAVAPLLRVDLRALVLGGGGVGGQKEGEG